MPDLLKESLKQYESFAFMSFEQEYGKGIMHDKKRIAEVVQKLLVYEIKQRHIISKGAYEDSDISSLFPSKQYDSE